MTEKLKAARRVRARRRIWAEAEALRIEAAEAIAEIRAQNARTPQVEPLSEAAYLRILDNTDRVLRRHRRRSGIGA